MSSLCVFLYIINPYNKQNIEQLRGDMDLCYSTVTALLEATNSWSVNIDNGLINGVVFIDLKKLTIR